MNLAQLQDTNQYIKITCISIYYEKSEREIKEPIPFTIATKRIKYLGINLPKQTKEVYTENYKPLMKEIKDTQTDGEIFHVPGQEESILCKYDYTMKCNIQI